MVQYEFPEKYEAWIEEKLSPLGYSLYKPEALAKAIKATSDHYLSKKSLETPWAAPQTTAAYLSYFFPLNYVRTLKVIAEAKSLDFFENITMSIDFGCGPGTSTKALLDQALRFPRMVGIDTSPTLKSLFCTDPALQYRLDRPPLLQPFLLLMSYALNELTHAPDWFYKSEAVMILEPSSHQQSQNLQEYRQHLIDKGFSIWGPCLHQEACPLLQSKKDWCHNRAYWTPPKWFKAIDNLLPMDNHSLAFSYILARKTPPPKREGFRIIGDARVEKGKTRWLVCDTEGRRFLSALNRFGSPPRLYRGDIYENFHGELKGNEWRILPKDESSS